MISEKSYRDRCLYTRVGLIINDFKIFVFVIENWRGLPANVKLRQCVRFARKLKLSLFEVIEYRWTSPPVHTKSPGCRSHCCANMCVSNAYEAMLNGTPKNNPHCAGIAGRIICHRLHKTGTWCDKAARPSYPLLPGSVPKQYVCGNQVFV